MDKENLKVYDKIKNDKFKELLEKYDQLKETLNKLENIDKILNSELSDIDKINHIKDEYSSIKIDKK